MNNTRPPRLEPNFRGGIRPRSPSEMLEPSRAPPPPQRTSLGLASSPAGTIVRFGSALLTVLLVIMVAVAAVGALLYHQFERPGPLNVSRVIAIPRGEGRIEIATRLEDEGVISNRWTFIATYLLQNAFGKKAGDFKAGEYEFKKNASMADVFGILTQGRAILSKLTIPEGLTSLQIVERVRAEPDLAGDIAEIPSEGTLLPDTYRFSKGIGRQELIERMQAEMQRFLASAWEKRQPDLPIKTPDEAVVFASIVEKETGRADERDRVAGVFVNRIRKGMRLQSDPTVIYGIVGGQGLLGRSLTRADLDQKTTHNTYQIEGLPPTPICNPGRSAIEATLNPASTPDLFFVADGKGGHVFSATLKGHNAAVSNWRKVEREMRAKKEAEDKAAAAASASALPIPSSKAGTTVPMPERKPKH
jgi:peptidoglycan lytic transglycosylase G